MLFFFQKEERLTKSVSNQLAMHKLIKMKQLPQRNKTLDSEESTYQINSKSKMPSEIP